MKGFFGALCIFLLWTAACIYYVSTSELEQNDSTIEVPSKDILKPIETITKEVPNSPTSETSDAPFEDSNDPELKKNLVQNVENTEINNINRSESQLLADEILMSIAVSDTVDFNRDEPLLEFEENVDLTTNPKVSSNIFYPYYRNTDLIMDKKLVAYAKELKKILKEDSFKRVTIVGHTDNVGNGKDNFSTGLKKARQVKWYLTARVGIPRKKIKAISRGEEKPIETNNSEWGRNKNNRVEIILE